MAQLQEDLQELPEAMVTYKEAFKNITAYPPQQHNRPSVIANMKVHMTICAYKAGEVSTVEKAQQALKELEEIDEPNKYSKDVWVSGGYMRLADALKKDNPSLAKEYLTKAKQIIDANPELTVRKQQWEKLSLAFQ